MSDGPTPRSFARLAFVVLLVALAGCSGLLGQGEQGATATPTETAAAPQPGGDSQPSPSSSTDTPVATPTATATPTQTTGPVDADNPFGERTLTVAIDDPVADRDFRPMVREALDYWEANSAEYAGYPVEFRLVDPGEDARIRIEITEGAIECDSEVDHRTTGCAPLNDRRAPDTSEIQIGTGYSDHYTYEIAVHELGHALGIRHGEPPEEFMAPTHASGISADPVRVYLTAENGQLSSLERHEITTALDYLATTSDLPASDRLDWQEVDSAAQADLIVEAGDGDECSDTGGGACSADAAYEDQTKLVLDNLDHSTYAWYTAALLAPAFFDDGEVPEELTSEADYDEREGWSG